MKKIVILHGWTKSKASWDAVVSCLRTKGADVLFPDIPGLTDGTDPVWGLDDYVEWLKSMVGNESIVLVGHSNGGRIAIAFSAAYPQQVERLVLVDSAGIPLKDPIVLAKNQIFKLIAKAGRKFTTSEKMRSVLYKAARVSDYPNATLNMRKTMENLIKVDLTSVLSRVKAPTLIIWGDQDRVTPLVMAKTLVQNIADARLELIPGGRHAPHGTHPDRVCELIYEHAHADI